MRSLGDKKGRNAAGLFVAEGPKLVTELVAGMGMAARLRVRRVLCTVAGAEHFGKAVRALREAMLSAARAMFWEKVLVSSGRKTVACRAREVGTAVRR
ncbi:MAG: hypothetical protein ACLR1G_15765 [Alistipes indistinctus]